MKKQNKEKWFRVSFSGAIDIKAENESEAREIAENLSNEEIGSAVEDIDEVQEIKN